MLALLTSSSASFAPTLQPHAAVMPVVAQRAPTLAMSESSAVGRRAAVGFALGAVAVSAAPAYAVNAPQQVTDVLMGTPFISNTAAIYKARTEESVRAAEEGAAAAAAFEAKKEANKAKREDRIAAEKEARKAAKSALEASKK